MGHLLKVGIINVTGYSGVELARCLSRHPYVDIVSVTGRSAVGKKLGQVFPHLAHLDLTIQDDVDEPVDVVFSALPQVASAQAVVPLLRSGLKVIDISADFRLKSAEEYQEWYGVAHPAPDLLDESVYGLTELYRDDIRSAQIVANPGCYPTGALLALAPVVRECLIEPWIIIDSKSGVSGAGRGPSLTTNFSEINENAYAYNVEGHRHLPEMVQEIKRLSPGFEPAVTFLPHLIPMTRGILTSCYATLRGGAFGSVDQARQSVLDLYRTFYQGEHFVAVLEEPPQTKHTWGSNKCLVYPTVDLRTGRLVVISAIDNLMKGAAGQAIQNMNLMFGLPDHTGLEHPSVYP